MEYGMLGNQRGDTLVEVLVAIAVMTTVTVGVLGILNRGVGEAQNASERVAVRALASEQTELLNYFRDNYVQTVASGGDRSAYPASVWGVIRNRADASSTLPSLTECQPSSQAFYFERNTTTNQYEVKGFNGSRVASATPSINNGSWIDVVKPDISSIPNNVPYIDFVVKACWRPISGEVDQNLSSAVRLYDRDI